MSDEVNGAGERFAIGISFGNSSSSIARINPVRSPAILALLPATMGRKIC
jgi:molecular chaperone DnaK (HSP70)